VVYLLMYQALFYLRMIFIFINVILLLFIDILI